MGNFWRLTFHDGRWQPEARDAPSLTIDVHDSDIATVDIRPAGPGSTGRFHLGCEPRDYFGDPAASDPVDVDSEAAGFAGWVRAHVGSEVAVERVVPLLATAGSDEVVDVFVDVTVMRLLDVAGIPRPTADEIASGNTLHP